MWLEKDERRLLAGYYSNIPDVGVERWFRVDDLARFLKRRGHRAKIQQYLDGAPSEPTGQAVGDSRAAIVDIRRVQLANKRLTARRLIEVRSHQGDTMVVGVSLAVEGSDLGRKYCSWFASSGLWFNEYRNHWIWLIVAFLGGLAGGVTSKFFELVLKLIEKRLNL